ncbi:DNA topoisomerase I [Bacillus toyonensis]|uniref:type IA DNA topoisomerase n=1 Tax=Bacillus toyonensis TaxID=155322 RepID=UPI000BEFAE2D|nr:type IA DNA topoisomerase [Bacillus toyonensis]PEM13106.1 DNA topoisomerase I [Bacillus toyonensis]PGA41776.1 DNA topoisomerase I [Bacillus toyonensis]PGB27269.1 DNA topoisomerase I [Bacillus toyonensis]PGC29865.1 DNA topoisomerase I [Bacillus toyonensis]PHF79654.1 DNA topoisomerase I [Bacillus toyonensis]
MGKTLFIAEKPKVAVELLKSPRFRNSQKHPGSKPYYGYYENENYIISWCRGHLLELKHPEEMDERYKEFKFDYLPIILEPEYKTKSDSLEQIQILVKLLNRPDVDHVVNSCDADREGELIYREIVEHAGVNKRESRLFISSYEAAELEGALNRLEPGTDYDGLAQSAKARQYLDYILGINVTRGCTSKLARNQFLLASGRVQMCILNEIRQREIAIQNYKEQTYYNLKLLTENGLTPVMKTEDQLIDPSPLQKLGDSLKETNIIVTEFKESTRKKKPKLLYNLTDIYKDAHAKMKINAETAKKHIQSLYEEGFITYPRSSSRHLPTEQVERVKEVMAALEKSVYANLVQQVVPSSITKKHSTFNDELVSSHFAIIPTTKSYVGTNRNPLEKQLYDLIAKRFIGNFMKPAIYLAREVHFIDQEGNTYSTKEKILQEKGFLSVFQEDIEEGSVEAFQIPVLQEGDSFRIVQYDLIESRKKKPAFHTESSILTFMETAGRKLEDEHLKELMKGKRIGTVATEETFIPKLLERSYIDVTNSQIRTTNIGRAFIDAFPVDEIKNPAYTAEMEGMIYMIEKNEMKYEEFVEKTNTFVKGTVEQLGAMDDKVSDSIINTWNQQIEVCKCPCRKGKILHKGNFYGCSNYPECEISLPKKIKEKAIPEAQAKKLFEDKKTDLLKGFKSNEKEFSAYLVLHEGKVKFQFPTQEELSFGKCPKCKKGDMLHRKTFYGCTEHKNGCDFMLPAKMKGKAIPGNQMKKLIQYKTTDFINGFQGEKGEFTAAIYMEADGSLKFRFPTTEDRTIGKCPLCKSRVLIGKSNYLCEKYKKGCDFIIFGTFSGKNLSSNHVKKLLEKNVTDQIKGFISNKNGKKFDARLSYSVQEKRLKFLFGK